MYPNTEKMTNPERILVRVLTTVNKTTSRYEL